MQPPQTYTIRVSARARHVRLCLSLRDGLVVVVPRGFDQHLLPGLLEQKRRWLERAWTRLQAGHGQRAPATPAQLPVMLNLQAAGEEWTVEYHATNSPRVTVRESAAHGLRLAGHTSDRHACIAALRCWLNRKAHQHLEPLLAQLAREGGFRYNRVFIKAQRTRWGSCSTRGNISLSLKLLFLPPELVRYVLWHELCHTVEKNHGRRFWALLQHHDPECQFRRKQMRTAGRMVPVWLDERKRSRARR